MVELLSALALVFIIEGLLPFSSPKFWKAKIVQLVVLPDQTLRAVGLVSIIIGLVLLTLVRP